MAVRLSDGHRSGRTRQRPAGFINTVATGFFTVGTGFINTVATGLFTVGIIYTGFFNIFGIIDTDFATYM